jgi:hypothetical protein
MPFNGLGAIGQGFLGGMKQATDDNRADAELGFKKVTIDRQLRQEQAKLLGEVLQNLEKNPEATYTALQDPNYASSLGISGNAYVSLMSAAKSKLEEHQHGQELMRLYGSNQLTPEHLKTFSRGIPRAVAASKDFQAYIDQQGLEGASSHIYAELDKIPSPDARRRALPGIITRYSGEGGPGRAGRAATQFKIMDSLGGPMSTVEDQNRARVAAGNILDMHRRGVMDSASAKRELGLAGFDNLTALGLAMPEALQQIKQIEAEGAAAGKIIGEDRALSTELPEVKPAGVFTEEGAQPTGPRTIGERMALHRGLVSEQESKGQYRGPLIAYDEPNPSAPKESFGVTEDRKNKAKGLAGETPALKEQRQANAALDRVRASIAELQKDDKNIAAAKRLVDAMSTAAIANHIIRSLPPDEAAVLKQWAEKAKQLINASPVTPLAPRGPLPGQGGAAVPRSAPAGGTNNGWSITEIPPKR